MVSKDTIERNSTAENLKLLDCFAWRSRWKKLISGEYPQIISVIALPENIFPEVVFHSEILFFNIKGLKSHYFLPKNEPK